MAFGEFFVNGDYHSFVKAVCNELDALRMRKRNGVWEIDPGQFTFHTYDFIFYDEMDTVIFLAHQFDHTYSCTECGITEREARASVRHRSCPGQPYRKGVLPFFNYHPDKNGWAVVDTNSYVTVEECDAYVKGRL